ncbi:MAG TPA: DUF2970 domain-containing protein [Burkholderiaceae bacterium]|nr:DUF2970 domain-containing protein [Burkholderiaceae bacterium]
MSGGDERPGDEAPGAAETPALQRPLSFTETASAVFWSFFGVRKRGDYARDAARLNPVYVVLMGIAGAALFVFTLIMIVRIVVRH